MSSYTSQIAIEAVSVGALSVGAFLVVNNFMPNSDVITQTFVAGAALHLTLEALGVNKWYLTNGAASYS